MTEPLRLGTRASALALAQAELVAGGIDGAEIVEVRGERDSPRGGDKARFVRAIEDALADGEVDLGVHSAKDLPAELPEGLALVGVPMREDPADAYLGAGASPSAIPEGARVGTSSLRRRSQLLAARADLTVTELRGNVDTRLERLGGDDLDGIVLALAGLRRLRRDGEIAFAFAAAEMVPAPGQGALALEAREGDERAAAAAAALTDRNALIELTAERAVVARLGASCNTPVGISARLEGEELSLDGFAGLPDGDEWVRDSVRGDAQQPGALGDALAERMLAAGAGELLERAEALAERGGGDDG